MARVADSLLMNIYLDELHDGSHLLVKSTLSIVNLINNGEINDDAVISLCLGHYHQSDKFQKQAVYALANICFNRLTTFRAFNNQIETETKDIKEFLQLFCLEFCKLPSYLTSVYLFFFVAKMILSFEGEKDWEFIQIFTKINMKMLKQK